MLQKDDLAKHNNFLIEAVEFLRQKFAQDTVFYFHRPDLKGYVYQDIQRFVAKNFFPKEFEQLEDKASHDLEVRVFCQTTLIQKTDSLQDFCAFLNLKQQAPVFFLVPYCDVCPAEDFSAFTPRFEVNLRFCNGLPPQITCVNFSADPFLVEGVLASLHALLLTSSTVQKTALGFSLPVQWQRPEVGDHVRVAIGLVKKHLIRGDAYLANVATTVTLATGKTFLDIRSFCTLWLCQQRRYGVYFCDGDHGLACFSPERFLATQNGLVKTEPIKGTLKSAQGIPTMADAQALWANKKEMFEHTLVVDLLRNDLASVCQAGSVQVVFPFYSGIAGHLLQMQSTVVGRLKTGVGLGTCLERMLPAGSVTGTPKKRVRELIATYENAPRGYYTGICGVLEPNGNAESIVLIRSLYMGKKGVYLGVGAGVTTLSSVKSEVSELRAKLSSFFPPAEDLQT